MTTSGTTLLNIIGENETWRYYYLLRIEEGKHKSKKSSGASHSMESKANIVKGGLKISK